MTKNGYVFHAERLTGGASANLDDGYQELIAAIIRQAVKDYVSVLLRLFSKPDGTKRTALEMQKTELEVFFHSEWYASITDLDGDRLISAARRQAVEKEKEAIRGIVEQLPYSHLSLEGWNGDVLMEKFEDPLWDELYKPCLACGTCTFVCPTCQCYDIKDYDAGKNGVQRYRCWDSCMYSDFTMMAHGNNRKSQKERFRQRFMHKLVYYPANNDGMYSCVGCGRCVEKCPASLNIVKVVKAFQKQGGEQ